MKYLHCVFLLLLSTACGSVESRKPRLPDMSTAFVAQGASVCNADEARVADYTGAEIGNRCASDGIDYPRPFDDTPVYGCVVADFGPDAGYGELEVVAYSWDEERCGQQCPDGTYRIPGMVQVAGADDTSGTNPVVYQVFEAATYDGSSANPAVSDPRRYVFACQVFDPTQYSMAVDIDVIAAQ